MRAFVPATLSFLAAAACAGLPDAPPSRTNPRTASSSKAVSVKDPTATWGIPINDGSLSLKSDRRFGDGTLSVYANGVCGVSTRIFATTASGLNPSGDAVLETTYPKGKACGRTVIATYPDGGADTLAALVNVNKLESPDASTVILLGQTALRRLIVGFGADLLHNPSVGRCGRLIFGDNGMVGAGTDMPFVTRIDATTWHVQSQPAPNNRALCENLGEIYGGMTVDFLIVANSPLP